MKTLPQAQEVATEETAEPLQGSPVHLRQLGLVGSSQQVLSVHMFRVSHFTKPTDR